MKYEIVALYAELVVICEDYSILRKSRCHSVNVIAGPLGLIYTTAAASLQETTHGTLDTGELMAFHKMKMK